MTARISMRPARSLDVRSPLEPAAPPPEEVVTKKHAQPQPKELKTGQRLATTGRAVIQGVAHQARGKHETEEGVAQRTDPAQVERITDAWPEAQKNVARQMLT